MEPTMPPLRRTCIPVSTLSKALMVPKSRMFWNVRPIPIRARLCAPSRVMSCPRKRKLPAVGLMRPLTMLKNVVFPAPFGPMRLTMDLSGMSKSTELTATSPPKTLVMPRASRMLDGVSSPFASDTGRFHDALFFLVQLLLALAVWDYAFGSQKHHGHQQDAKEGEILPGKVDIREQGTAYSV